MHDDVAALLATAGHDVHTVFTEGVQGIDDSALAERCRVEGRALVTLDLDFADIRTYPPAAHTGFIVLRVHNQSRRHVLSLISQVVEQLKNRNVTGQLWIVTEAGVRIRE